MSFLVDAIIIVLIALSIFIGYKKGLIRCAVNLLSFFIAILVVIILTTPVSNLIINNTKIDDNIKTSISENLDFGDADSAEIKLGEENSDSPEVVREYLNDIMLDATNDGQTSVTNIVAENLSRIIINIVVAIVLFIGTKFALMFVKVLADIVGKIPLISQFNKAGGIIYGIASGFVTVYVILAVISIIVPLLSNSSIVDAINSSVIGKSMYDNNILLKIIL